VPLTIRRTPVFAAKDTACWTSFALVAWTTYRGYPEEEHGCLLSGRQVTSL
jgi:hypothetical protein